MNNIFQKLKPYLSQALWALGIVFVLNVVLFKVVCVPSSDMKQTLGAGDMVLINKLAGPKQNDLIAFYDPSDSLGESKQLFVQRCVALPGEVVQINEGNVFVNKEQFHTEAELQFNYHIKTKGKDIDSLLRHKYNVTEGGKISDGFDFSYSLSPTLALELKKLDVIESINRINDKIGLFDEQIFPHNEKYSWNKYNMSGLIVPRKNERIDLDTNNICFYSTLITVHEKNTLLVKGDSILINGELTKSYSPKMDYYFVMGDNRDNAIDSRYWGFLPEDKIIGKMALVLAAKSLK